MKKKIVSLCLVVALIAIAAVGTLAYFTDKTGTKTNTFTFGDVNIKLTETSNASNGVLAGVAKDNNAGFAYSIVPGQTYAKEPTITNIGTNDAWVRMNVTVSDWAAFKALAGKYDGMNNLTSMFKGFDSTKWTLAGVTENDGDTATYAYYYQTKLAKTDTATLFESVTIPSDLTAEDMATLGNNFTIDVQAFAVQADGFDTAADAFGAVTAFETIGE